MRRREFLTLGSAAAIGAAASPLLARVRAVLPLSDEVQLSFGYTEHPAPGTQSVRPPVAADTLPAGDPRFVSTGARIGILGFWRAERNRSRPVSLAVAAWYAVAGVGKVPFVAWTYTADGQGTFASGRSPFVIPVDVTRSVELSVEATVPAPRPQPGVIMTAEELRAVTAGIVPVSAISPYDQLSKMGQVATLTLDFDRGMKLQPGYYVIAVQAKGERRPDWSSMTVADLTKPESLDAKGHGPLTQSHLFSSSAPDFDYLLVNVDIAQTAVPRGGR